MLGLGNSIGGYISGYSDPSSFGGLELWLGFNQGISSDENSSGGSVTHSVAADNMTHNTKVNQWNDLSGNSNNAVQTVSGDKPRWDITGNSGADLGGVKFPNHAKYMNLTSTINLTGDFTIMTRVRIVNLGGHRTFLGDSNDDYFHINNGNPDKFTLGLNGTDYAWEDASATDVTVGDPDYRQIITITRSSGALSLHVNGGTSAGGWNNQQDDVDWDSAETHSTTDTLTLSNIGSKADDGEDFNGFIFDMLIYTSALSEADRKLNYDYLNAQTT